MSSIQSNACARVATWSHPLGSKFANLSDHISPDENRHTFTAVVHELHTTAARGLATEGKRGKETLHSNRWDRDLNLGL